MSSRCDKRLQMKWNRRSLQEWKINSILYCLVDFSLPRDAKMYANCNNTEMAAGYCVALRLERVCMCVCVKRYN